MNQDTRNKVTGWAKSLRRSAENLIYGGNNTSSEGVAVESLIDQLHGAGELLELMGEHDLAAQAQRHIEAIEQFRRGFSAGRRFIPQAVREQANG